MKVTLATHAPRKRAPWGLALAVALSIGAGTAETQELGVSIGSQAPAAPVETLDGRAADLGQYIGKTPILLEFWAAWCSNCAQLEPALLAAHRKYGKQVKFVGVAVSVNQSPERVRRHMEKHKLPLEMLYDRRGHAVTAYDVPATSYVVVIDRAGKVVYTGSGGRQDLDAAIRKAL